MEQPPATISHLKRREIQVPIAACLIRGFAKAMGTDKALAVATAAIQADATVAGEMTAKRYGDNTMATLARVVREVWAENDAIVTRISEETERSLRLDV
ncbi:MAG: hypothetical protein FJ272_01405, partial [Planctomycetes bacterium]|nr:hypothetical protein [Planctomycetota bacterium]